MDKATVIAALVTLREQLEELEDEALKGSRAAATAVGEAQSVAYLRGKRMGLANAAELLRDLTGRIEKGWEGGAGEKRPPERWVSDIPSPRFGSAILKSVEGNGYLLYQEGFNQYPIDEASDVDALRVAAAVVNIRESMASGEWMRIPKPTGRCLICHKSHQDCRCSG